MRSKALAVLAGLMGALLIYSGGPTVLYYNFHEHHGSEAYHIGGGVSYLMDGDRHGRVCDNEPDLINEHGRFHDPSGNVVRVYDTNGRQEGCGNGWFDSRKDAHKTCTYKGCGAWSIH